MMFYMRACISTPVGQSVLDKKCELQGQIDGITHELDQATTIHQVNALYEKFKKTAHTAEWALKSLPIEEGNGQLNNKGRLQTPLAALQGQFQTSFENLNKDVPNLETRNSYWPSDIRAARAAKRRETNLKSLNERNYNNCVTLDESSTKSYTRETGYVRLADRVKIQSGLTLGKTLDTTRTWRRCAYDNFKWLATPAIVTGRALGYAASCIPVSFSDAKRIYFPEKTPEMYPPPAAVSSHLAAPLPTGPISSGTSVTAPPPADPPPASGIWNLGGIGDLISGIGSFFMG